jgi:quercetin dioxygenase-like cupin family protein
LANRIATSSQFTEDIEGYVFDGTDGSQVALWTAHADRVSTEHVHDFDEHVLVIEGRCVLIVGERRIKLRAGQEFVIPRGTMQGMDVSAVTRTMHVLAEGALDERASPPEAETCNEGVQRKSTRSIKQKFQGFTAEERAAMRQHARELKAEARGEKGKSDGEGTLSREDRGDAGAFRDHGR